MNAEKRRSPLKSGDWVVVRSKEEILATLDQNGRLEQLPFMPEMFQYCGQRLRVVASAHKTCDYISLWDIRRMKDSVFLEGVRCDGEGHGGCQALCLIFWKEAWLQVVTNEGLVQIGRVYPNPHAGGQVCTEKRVGEACKSCNAQGETIYSCQGTDVAKYTTEMRWWDPKQWIQDVTSGNLHTGLAGDTPIERRLEKMLAVIRIVRSITVFLVNRRLSRIHGWKAGTPQYPRVDGTAEKTPREILNIQPGEIVQVRSKEEIMATLNKDQRNRGLWFDSEQLPYCGGIYRVLRRVNRIIEEQSGRMIEMKNPCLILEGVVCKGDFHRLCQRAIYSYWRESWVRRVAPEVAARLPLAGQGSERN